MLTPLKLIAEIDSGQYTKTIYFYSFSTKTLLPITVNHKYFLESRYPGVHDTLYRVLKAMGADLVSVKIYLFKDSKFYTYLSIFRNNRCYEINCSFEDALEISKISRCRILAKSTILEKQGIKVTSELIKKALTLG